MLYSFPGKCVLMLASGRILDISCFPIAATFGVVPPCLGWMSKPLHYSYSGPTTAFAPSPVAIIECVKSLRSLSQGPIFPQRTLRYVRNLLDSTLQISGVSSDNSTFRSRRYWGALHNCLQHKGGGLFLRRIIDPLSTRVASITDGPPLRTSSDR